MEDLSVLKLYNESSERQKSGFSDKVDSTLKVISDYDKVECDFGWLELMESTIPYIDNILRNPNRFIVNEEDVIKIELAKRVTVESIKHLSRNTNLIQDYDKKTGDVKPSKILNITKEESYDTYENRLIYTLIKNMKYYVTEKTKDIVYESSEKRNKTFEYNGVSGYAGEKVDISMRMNSKYSHKNSEKNAEGVGVEERIEKLNNNIAMLTNSDVYKVIDKKHIALVTPPIKKTNVIIKNVNFQYAMKLWEFLQENVPGGTTRNKEKKEYMDNGELKGYVDETFMLNYLVMNSLDKNGEELSREATSEVQEKLVGNMIKQVIDINEQISEEQLKDIVEKQFTVIKYRHVVSDKNIKKLFRQNIDKYLEKIVGIG